jgi:peptidoglycan/LPS O-acetylase OafA/YrhL
VQLYLLYPVLIALVRRFSWKTSLLIVCGLEITLRLIAGLWSLSHSEPAPVVLTYGPLYFWFSWTLGAYLAHRYLSEAVLEPSWLLTGILLATVVGLSLYEPLSTFCFLIFAVFCFALLARFIFVPKTGNLKGWLGRHLSFVGVCSYSFYLLHQPMMGWWAVILSHWNYWSRLGSVVQLLFFIPLWFIVLLAAHLSYRYIERPSIALGKSLWMRVYPAAAVIPAASSQSLAP